MVTKSLSNGADGNLLNDPSKGVYADKITVLHDATGFSYTIFTYGSNDLVDTRLSNTANQNAAALGYGNDAYLGGAASDTVFDGNGKDSVSLGGGSDFMRVSAGDDVYNGGTGNDYLSFQFRTFNGTGSLTLNTAAVVCDLAVTTRQNFGVFGNDIVRNFEFAEGGSGNDRLFGTAGNNRLYGNDGNDNLQGRAGADKLYGGKGNDILSGGTGADHFYSDAGADSFYCAAKDHARDVIHFSSVTDSGISNTTWDKVFGFEHDTDKIDLSTIDANPGTATNDAFIFLSGAAFTPVAGEVRIIEQNGFTLVQVDTDADATPEMVIAVQTLGLTRSDFIL